MNSEEFNKKLKVLFNEHEKLISKKNEPLKKNNGIFTRYKNPVVTADHTPLFWRYDLDYKSNPNLIERLGVNGAFNSGAIELNDKILLVVRVEGNDRKSFLAVAESKNGIDNFRFWDYPIEMPETVIRILMFMMQELFSMKMDGFTQFFVRKEKTTIHRKVIHQPQLHKRGLQELKI